jgi:hypothetical protein
MVYGEVHPRVCKSGAEEDVVYARKWYCYTKRPRVTSKIKRQMRRRERREAKTEIRTSE